MNSFNYCYSLTRLILPEGPTSVMRAFTDSCYCLGFLRFPSTAKTIGSTMLNGATALSKVVIGGALTKMPDSAFAGCESLKIVDLSKCTAVPTLANVNAFNGVPADCEIRVPAALADEWKAAANWSSFSGQIVGV